MDVPHKFLFLLCSTVLLTRDLYCRAANTPGGINLNDPLKDNPATQPATQPTTRPKLTPSEQKAKAAERQLQTAIDQLQYLIETGHAKEALADVIKLRAKTTPENRDPRIEAMAAQIALAEEKPEAAWQLIHPWAEHGEKLHEELARPYLALADTYIAKEEYDKALKVFDWLSSGLSKTDPPSREELVLATEGCGMACFYLDRTKNAQDSLKFALKVANQRFPDPKGKDKWLIDRIKAELKMVTPSEDAEKYGEDYVLFRNAEKLRLLSHQPKKAIDLYSKLKSKFPESPFAEPACLHSALCLLIQGNKDEAQKSLEAFIASSPNGLYTGEALLELGRLCIEYRLDPKAATPCFEKMEKWLKNARKPSQNLGVAATSPSQSPNDLRPVTRKIVTPPQKKTTTDFFGNVDRAPVAPGELVNQITCPWYLDDLELQACVLHGFLLTTQGKKEQALTVLHRLVELDPQVAQDQDSDQPNDFSRLSAGAKQGYYMASPKELALYNERLQFIVMLGDVYYCDQQFEKSESLFARLLKGEFGPLSATQQDYPHYAIATNLYRRKRREGDLTDAAAIAEYEKVLDQPQHTFTKFRAGMAYANLSRYQSDPKVTKRGILVLKDLVASNEQNEYTMNARIALAMVYADNSQWAQASEILKSFSESDGFHYSVAQVLLKEYAERKAKNITGQPPK